MESFEACSSSKKARLETSCTLCGKYSHFSEKAEEYTKLLITNLVSPFERDVFIKDDKLICFEFCVACGLMLDQLLELKKALQFISDGIKSKVDEVKLHILKNENAQSSQNKDEINSKFRKIMTRDLRPVVRLDLQNVLVKKKVEDFESISMNSDNFSNNTDIRSHIIEIDPRGFEYFDGEEEIEPWEETTIECYENGFPAVNCSSQNGNNSNSSLKNSEMEWQTKPNFRYCQLAIIALTSTKDNCAFFDEIYYFILANFPFYKSFSSFRPCLLRGLNLGIFEKEKEPHTSKHFFRLTTKLGPKTIEDIITVLNSPKVLKTMTFPERQLVFIENLLNLQRKTSLQNKIAKETRFQPMEQATSQWQRPPFQLSQIIFIGLSNCVGKRAKSKHLVECIRNTFPFFLAKNPVKTWKQCLHTTLFINKCFTRSGMARYDPINDIWSINEKEAESMRDKIKQVLESEKLSTSTFMATPEVALKNALSQSYEDEIPNSSNQSLNVAQKNCSSYMIENLLDKPSNQANSSAKSEIPAIVINPAIQKNAWQVPPLNFAQLIFLALCNFPERRANVAEIMSKIRDIFPFVNGLHAKWERGATTVLFQNESFVKTNNENTELRKHIFTLNEKAADGMRNDIKNALRNSSAIQANFMKTPVEILRNALIYELSPTKTNDINGQVRQDSDVNISGWIKPPFTSAQIIFVALSNCTEKQGNPVAIIERIRSLFPWYLDFVAENLLDVTTILLGNDNFVRIDIPSEAHLPHANQTWTINEKVAYCMRNEISSIVEREGRNSLSEYLVNPEEAMRKTLIVENSRPTSVNSNENGKLPKKVKKINGTPTRKLSCDSSNFSSSSKISMDQEVYPQLESTSEIDIGEIKIEQEFTAAPQSPINTPIPFTIVEQDNINKNWTLPPFTISLLAAFTIANNNYQPMTGFSICESIANYFPYYQKCRKTLSEKIYFSLRNRLYFVEGCSNKDKNLLRFSLNIENKEAMAKLKSEIYDVFKKFYIQTYEAFSKPSKLYPMLRNLIGSDFDLGFLQSVTVYRHVE